jgi:hypothetical protein
MRYIVWTEADVDGLRDLGIHRLVTEVNASGAIEREVGFDADRSPSAQSPYGLFDNQIAEGEAGSELEQEAFEEYWSREEA